MKIYTCTDFEGIYPVGASAVILANSKHHAKILLLKELEKIRLGKGLREDIENNTEYVTFEKISQTSPVAVILQDGDY